MDRTILLVDMNAFYASVHQALDASLRGLPVVVGGNPESRHGIVLTASYEAKHCGVKTGMTVGEAMALCPQAVFVPPCHHLYVDFSTRILNILRDFSPLVEPYSIDEAFVDLTGCLKLFHSGEDAALAIKKRIRGELNLTCSIGIGPNKLLAKMAAEMKKPDGLTVLDYQNVPARMWPLAVRELFGVGPRTDASLSRLNIRTIGDLARYPADILKKRFGLNGLVLSMSARGIDYSPVDPHALERAASIGHQITLPRDYHTHAELRVILLELAVLVGRRARTHGYCGRTISLTLKDVNFHSIIRNLTLPCHTARTNEIYAAAAAVLSRHWPEGMPVRMVGLTLGDLARGAHEQLDIFGERERQHRLDLACDRVKERFGEKSIFRAVSLTRAGIFFQPVKYGKDGMQMDRGNKLWDGHRMMQPELGMRAVHQCQNCLFFTTVIGRREKKTGCLASVEAYAGFKHRVPEQIEAAALLRLVGTEGLSRVLSCGGRDRPACGTFKPRLLPANSK